MCPEDHGGFAGNLNGQFKPQGKFPVLSNFMRQDTLIMLQATDRHEADLICQGHGDLEE